MKDERTAAGTGSGPLAAAYWSFLGALGVYGPFLAGYLEDSRGLSPSAAAYVLAILPIAATIATPLWTLVADRLGSADRVLRVVAAGALLSFGVLVAPGTGIVFVAVTLVVFTVFRAPGGALIDVLALDLTARNGVQFGRIRAWGTAGYTLGAVGTGFLVKHFGASSMILATLAMLLFTTVAAFRLPRAPRAASLETSSLLPGLRVLLKNRRFALFLVTAVLNQIGLAPYDSLFPARLTAIAGAELTGIAIALGTASEFLVMVNAHAILRRLGVGRTLALAYAGSAVRWAIIALATDPWVLTGAQLLHGLTYGAFYAAAVSLVNAEAPAEVRASAQGIFSTVTWGIAAAAALALAGALQRTGGMSLVFTVATGASILGTLLAFWLHRPREKAAA